VSDGWTTSRSSGQGSDLFVRDMLLASELTQLPSADPTRDELLAMIFNADTGRFFVRTPFLHHFQNQGPEWLVPELKTRPSSHALLKRWEEGDLARLKLPARGEAGEALRKAVNK
jgi:hypothetical protein